MIQVLPVIGYKNVGDIANGIAITDDGEFYSATALANLKIDGLPNSRAGIYKKADRENWPFINVPGKGSKDGVIYYKVPKSVIEKKYSSKDDTNLKVKRIAQNSAEYIKSDMSETVNVKRYSDVKGSAGPGYINDSDGLIELVEFNSSTLKSFINVPAQYLVIGAVDGYSMEPFLFHGDQVFIDTRYQTFKNDGVYALLHDGELRYKRVRVNYADNTLLLKSDNDGGLGPELLNEDQANNLKIIGKVIPFKFGHFKL